MDKNAGKIHALMPEDRHQTIEELEILAEVSWSSVQGILTKHLSMTSSTNSYKRFGDDKGSAQVSPWILTDHQKE